MPYNEEGNWFQVGPYSDYQLNIIFQRSGGDCHLCYHPHERNDYWREWNVDHVLASKNGGDDSYENLNVACVECNKEKLNKLMRDLTLPFQCPKGCPDH